MSRRVWYSQVKIDGMVSFGSAVAVVVLLLSCAVLLLPPVGFLPVVLKILIVPVTFLALCLVFSYLKLDGDAFQLFPEQRLLLGGDPAVP